MNASPRRSARLAAAPTRWWFPSGNTYLTAPGGRSILAAAPAAPPRNRIRRATPAEAAAMWATIRASNERHMELKRLRLQVAQEAAEEGYARLHYADKAEEDAVW